jgi:hypothetical protein
LPTASCSALLVAFSAWMSRGRCCGVPWRAVPLKAKLASRTGLGRTLACWLRVWNASHSFQAASGSDPTSAASFGMAVE